MSASAKHKDYESNVPLWETTRDCVKGANTVKSRRTKYLPMPNPGDRSRQNLDRYNDYLKRANFVNYTAATLDGMLGMVFRKPMQIDLQPSIEYIEENVNGAGLTLEQSIRSIISNVLMTGRHGLLVDYPPAPEGLSAAEVRELELRANIMAYKAEDVINWREDSIGGKRRLTLVTLKEAHEKVSEDGFETSYEKWHRVLRLVDGIYIQQLYDENDELVEEVYPRDAVGSLWNEIPFVFVGATNNDPDVDRSPLYDIADLNISHYRNSADFEDASFMVGQPTPIISGLDQSWVDSVLKEGVTLGSRRAVLLPEGGRGDLLQASENSMPERGMQEKEKQMIRIGARLIMDNAGVETAEAARIRFAGQNSKLAAVLGNVESALIKCLDWCMQFMGGEGENVIELNSDFYDAKIDPQLVMAMIHLMDRGVIAMSDMRASLRDEGLIDAERTDEEIEAEAEEGAMGDAIPAIGTRLTRF